MPMPEILRALNVINQAVPGVATLSWAEALGTLFGLLAIVVSLFNLTEALGDLYVPTNVWPADPRDRKVQSEITWRTVSGEIARMIQIIVLTGIGLYASVLPTGQAVLRPTAWLVPAAYALVMFLFFARAVNDLIMRRNAYRIYHA